MKHLWTVESGSYSDWRIHAVLDTEADATAAAQLANGAPDNYKRHTVGRVVHYPTGQPAKLVTEYRCSVNLWDNGNVGDPQLRSGNHQERSLDQMRVPLEDVSVDWDGTPPKRPTIRFVRAPIHDGKGGRLEVFGSDRVAVVKAFNDRVMQHLAGERMRATA